MSLARGEDNLCWLLAEQHWKEGKKGGRAEGLGQVFPPEE